jgi:hypothetical protein
MAKVIVGLFSDRVSAEHALVDLRASGFDTQRMGIVMRDPNEARETGASQGVTSTAGAVTGGVIGGTLGAILAATGTLVIPGIGPFISGGILATALAGGAAGWLVGGLVGLGLSHEEAQYYQGRVEQGGVLISVDPQGRDEEARQILLKNGAENLDAEAPWSPMPEREAAPRDAQAEPVRDQLMERDQVTDRGQVTDRQMAQDVRADEGRGEISQGDSYERSRGQTMRDADAETAAPRDTAARDTTADGDAETRPRTREEQNTADASGQRPAMDQDIIAERDVPPRE